MTRRLRILALPRYARIGASSRLRFFQFLPALEAEDFDVDVAPLFDADYVRDLQSGRRRPVAILRSYLRRLATLLFRRGHDIVWLEKELFPWLPWWVERLLLARRGAVVVDYDDAVFLIYEQHRRAPVRRFLGDKHRHLMRRADAVVAGNRTLAAYARDAGARRVIEIPTSVDVDRYRPSRTVRGGEGAVVGWIGQASTAPFLRPLSSTFLDLDREKIATFRAVGIDTHALGLPMQSVRWSEESETDAIAAFDIGIMPLPDTPFERGKCAYKLIQYMASGLPVIASPVGANCDVVEDGVTGILASSIAEWREAIARLAADPDLRLRMGTAGRARVERDYAMHRAALGLAQVFRSVVRD